MQVDGKDVIELIRIKDWAILEIYRPEEGPGVSHLPCKSWIRFGMHEDALYCRKCQERIPEEIVTLWLLLSADKSCSYEYYKGIPHEVR